MTAGQGPGHVETRPPPRGGLGGDSPGRGVLLCTVHGAHRCCRVGGGANPRRSPHLLLCLPSLCHLLVALDRLLWAGPLLAQAQLLQLDPGFLQPATDRISTGRRAEAAGEQAALTGATLLPGGSPSQFLASVSPHMKRAQSDEWTADSSETPSSWGKEARGPQSLPHFLGLHAEAQGPSELSSHCLAQAVQGHPGWGWTPPHSPLSVGPASKLPVHSLLLLLPLCVWATGLAERTPGEGGGSLGMFWGAGSGGGQG